MNELWIVRKINLVLPCGASSLICLCDRFCGINKIDCKDGYVVAGVKLFIL